MMQIYATQSAGGKVAAAERPMLTHTRKQTPYRESPMTLLAAAEVCCEERTS